MALGRRARPRAETQRTNGQSNNEPSQHEPTNSKVGVSSTRNNWFCQNVPSRLRRTPCSERTGGRGLGSLCQASGRAPPDRTEWTKKHAIRLRETTFFLTFHFSAGGTFQKVVFRLRQMTTKFEKWRPSHANRLFLRSVHRAYVLT
jgi:hypothetical protein